MTSTHVSEEVVQDLPRIVLKTPPRTGTQAPRPSERPSTVPTIDSMLTEAREHRARCEAFLEALGAPVVCSAVNTSTKES